MLDMSQGCSQEFLPIICPMAGQHTPTNQFLPLREESTKHMTRPFGKTRELQDPLTRSKVQPDQVHQDPDWYTRIQQGTSKPKIIDYHVNYMIKMRGLTFCSPQFHPFQ